MKILFGLLTLIFLSGCALSPCGPTKAHFISKYDRFVNSLEDQELEYSDEAWENLDAEFKTFVNECYEEHEKKMTSEEKEDFAVNTVRYYYIKYGKGLYNKYGDDSEELVEIFTNKISEWGDFSAREIENAFDNLEIHIDEEAIENAMDKISEAIRDLKIKIEISED